MAVRLVYQQPIAENVWTIIGQLFRMENANVQYFMRKLMKMDIVLLAISLAVHLVRNKMIIIV